MTTTSLTGRALRRHERGYVRDVAQHLRDIPTPDRVALLREVEEHLADRPPTRDLEELERALGSPSDYAQSLREEKGFGAERTDWPARWSATPVRTRIIGVTSVVVVIALIVTTVVTVRWWIDWQADITLNSVGASFSGAQPAKGITETETVSASQTSVQYDSTRKLHVDFFFSSGRSLQITKVTLPKFLLSMLALEKMEVADARGDLHGNLVWKPFSSPVDVRRHSAGSLIRMTFGFRNCEWSSPGTGEIFDHVQVTYDALGRTRHQDVGFPHSMDLVVRSPSDAKCPARKPPVVDQSPEG